MSTPTVLEILEKTTAYFSQKNIHNPRLEAQLLIGHFLGLGRMELYLKYDRPLSDLELENCRTAVARRGRREPLQYILGKTAFRNLEIICQPHVLIPRPETEGLVELILKHLPEIESKNLPKTGVEIGVGTGAILCSLCTEKSDWIWTGTDISKEALANTELNLKQALRQFHSERGSNLNPPKLFEGDLFKPFPTEQKWSIIISNPPYISAIEYPKLMPEVLHHEPKLALVGGEKGWELPLEILREGMSRLPHGGMIFMEIGETQGEGLLLKAKALGYTFVSIHQDLAGKNRYLVAKAP